MNGNFQGNPLFTTLKERQFYWRMDYIEPPHPAFACQDCILGWGRFSSKMDLVSRHAFCSAHLKKNYGAVVKSKIPFPHTKRGDLTKMETLPKKTSPIILKIYFKSLGNQLRPLEGARIPSLNHHLFGASFSRIRLGIPTAALLQQSGRAIFIQSKRWTHKLPVKRFAGRQKGNSNPQQASATRRTPYSYTSPNTESLDSYGNVMGPADMGRDKHHPILPLTCWEPKGKNPWFLCQGIHLYKPRKKLLWHSSESWLFNSNGEL